MAAKLGRVCRDARTQAGLRLIDIALEADVSQGTVHYFERGDWWIGKTDAIVDAYARLCGVPALELWHAALREAEHDRRPG